MEAWYLACRDQYTGHPRVQQEAREGSRGLKEALTLSKVARWGLGVGGRSLVDEKTC